MAAATEPFLGTLPATMPWPMMASRLVQVFPNVPRASAAPAPRTRGAAAQGAHGSADARRQVQEVREGDGRKREHSTDDARDGRGKRPRVGAGAMAPGVSEDEDLIRKAFRTVHLRGFDVEKAPLQRFLENACGPVGPLVVSQASRGAQAWVEFEAEAGAKKALDLDGTKIAELRCATVLSVNYANNPIGGCRRTIHLVGLRQTVEDGEVQRVFEQLAGPVREVAVRERRGGRMAWVEFVEERACQKALEAVNARPAAFKALGPEVEAMLARNAIRQ